MKSKHKALLVALCVVLVLAASALGTFAYLTDSDAAKNTMTVGSVGIKLDEAEVNADGSYKNGHDNRTNSNKYHLLPGHTYYKDPTVTVDAGSSDAYVRMIVTVERIDQLKAAVTDASYYNGTTFLLEKLCGGWDSAVWKFTGYTESNDGQTGYYEFRYKEVVKESETATVLPDLFTHISIPGEVNNAGVKLLDDVKIVVAAHAIQAAGFEDNEAGAWAAFGSQNS